MKNRRLNALVFIGIMGVITWGSIFAVYAIRTFASDQNIYWTAQSMPLRLQETRDSFELFIYGDFLENHLSRGALTIQNLEGSRTVLLEDVSVRLNNWHRVKSSFLTHALWSGLLFSACATLLLVGVLQSLFPRKSIHEKSSR